LHIRNHRFCSPPEESLHLGRSFSYQATKKLAGANASATNICYHSSKKAAILFASSIGKINANTGSA
jgi:hypothetical protein